MQRDAGMLKAPLVGPEPQMPILNVSDPCDIGLVPLDWAEVSGHDAKSGKYFVSYLFFPFMPNAGPGDTNQLCCCPGGQGPLQVWGYTGGAQL